MFNIGLGNIFLTLFLAYWPRCQSTCKYTTLLQWRRTRDGPQWTTKKSISLPGRSHSTNHLHSSNQIKY